MEVKVGTFALKNDKQSFSVGCGTLYLIIGTPLPTFKVHTIGTDWKLKQIKNTTLDIQTILDSSSSRYGLS